MPSCGPRPGAVWDDVVAASLAHGLGGLECLSGIPGSAGATPVQNVGAYGAEVADTIRRVRLLDRRYRRGSLGGSGCAAVRLPHKHAEEFIGMRWCSRWSSRWIPPDAARRCATANWLHALGAEPGQRADPARVREAVLSLRAGKGMVLDDDDHDTWSVGSFFTNPVVHPPTSSGSPARSEGRCPTIPAPDGVKLAAGWLVERAGFGKGYPGATGTGPAVDQARPGCDQSGSRDHCRRDCAGQDGARRCPRGVRDRAHTRADSDRVRSLGTLGRREHRRSDAGVNRRRALTAHRGRVGRSGCPGSLYRIGRTSPRGDAAEHPDTPAITYQPANAADRRRAHRARSASRSTTAGSSRSR